MKKPKFQIGQKVKPKTVGGAFTIHCIKLIGNDFLYQEEDAVRNDRNDYWTESFLEEYIEPVKVEFETEILDHLSVPHLLHPKLLPFVGQTVKVTIEEKK